MARYQVDVRLGAASVLRTRVRARNAEGAQQRARGDLFVLGLDPSLPYHLTVRRRGLRRRTVAFAGGGGPAGPGLAGVREPRRPLPGPPSLRRALDGRL